MTESNYMNGNYMNAGQAGAEQDYSHTNHYHSSGWRGLRMGTPALMVTIILRVMDSPVPTESMVTLANTMDKVMVLMVKVMAITVCQMAIL